MALSTDMMYADVDRSFTNKSDYYPHDRCSEEGDSPFFDVLENGLPNIHLYPPDADDEMIAANEKRLEKAEELQYCPTGFEKLSEWLEKPLVKIAITISIIAVVCWFFPTALTSLSTVVLMPLRWLNSTTSNILSKIPIISTLTVTGHPLLQLVTGALTLAIGAYLSPEISKGAAANTLTYCSEQLVFERCVTMILGFIFNPKIFVQSSYHGTLLGMIFAVTVTIPLFEELIFRTIIPEIYTKTVEMVGKGVEVITEKDLQEDVEWFNHKTSAIFSSVIFGAMHFRNDHIQSFAQALYCGWSGIRLMEPLKEELGLTGSIGEHMANNTVAVTPMVLVVTLFELF